MLRTTWTCCSRFGKLAGNTGQRTFLGGAQFSTEKKSRLDSITKDKMNEEIYKQGVT